MQAQTPEQTEPLIVPVEDPAHRDILDLNIEIQPFLPDPLIPAWNFLQDYPFLLVLMMLVVGYTVGKAGAGWGPVTGGPPDPFKPG